MLGFRCGPGWTSHPGVERALTRLVAPSQCKDASQIPDSSPASHHVLLFLISVTSATDQGTSLWGTSLWLRAQRAAPTSP